MGELLGRGLPGVIMMAIGLLWCIAKRFKLALY